MKRIVAFFTKLFIWIKSIFKSKSEPKIIPEEVPAEIIPKKIIPKEKSIGVRSYPAHNNRKSTKGRFVQYVKFGNESKPIYHGAK